MNPTTQRSYGRYIWILALVGVTLDLGSKYLVFGVLYNDGRGGNQEIIPGAFRLLASFDPGRPAGDGLLRPLRTWGGEVQPRVNNGALFGLGGDDDGAGGNTVFAVISVLAAAAIGFWGTLAATRRDFWLCLALGLILGGTLGNLYDRLVFSGVRDFLDFYLIEFPVFNIADCCLVCGAGLLLIQAFFAQPAAADKPATSAAPAEAAKVP